MTHLPQAFPRNAGPLALLFLKLAPGTGLPQMRVLSEVNSVRKGLQIYRDQGGDNLAKTNLRRVPSPKVDHCRINKEQQEAERKNDPDYK